MTPQDYKLEISGDGRIRDFKLIKLHSNYPLPQVLKPTIKADDDSLNTPEGKCARRLMKGSGLEEIVFDSKTHTVRVIAAAENAWSDIESVEDIVRCHINSHFNAARKM
jgi:hypothetical protein